MQKKLINSPSPDTTTRTLAMSIAAEKDGSANFTKSNWFDNSIVVRPSDLPALLSLSRTTIWRLERSGDFPNRIRLSAGAVGYRMADIQAWLDSRKTVGGLNHGQ